MTLRVTLNDENGTGTAAPPKLRAALHVVQSHEAVGRTLSRRACGARIARATSPLCVRGRGNHVSQVAQVASATPHRPA
jgi:hypothetical protein